MGDAGPVPVPVFCGVSIVSSRVTMRGFRRPMRGFFSWGVAVLEGLGNQACTERGLTVIFQRVIIIRNQSPGKLNVFKKNQFRCKISDAMHVLHHETHQPPQDVGTIVG